MRQRGRRSQASLTLVTNLPADERHPPPTELSPEQAEVWRTVMLTRPQDWFSADTFPLLAAYSRHVVTARELSVQIDAVPAATLGDKLILTRLDTLLKMRRNETKALVELATAMRLSQYARYKSETAATAAAKASAANTDKPWT